MLATPLLERGEPYEESRCAREKALIPDKVAHTAADEWHLSFTTDMAGFSTQEEEEFLLLYGPKKVCKAIQQRRKAREQAPS
jgi:hypothetical protein